MLFFLKQKTAYEMRISDWSSDVCSSDLISSSHYRPRNTVAPEDTGKMMNNDNVAPGDKAMILLQSLICYLREKNVLSRADIEELRNRVEARMATPDSGLSCATALVAAA